MIDSKNSDVINADIDDNSSSPALGYSPSVPCSICFDLVIDDGERSIAKLQCGHKFHLDCIGSAFNTKGTMQCPNCRKVESGRWLFAEGSGHAISETGTQDWMLNVGPHDLSYSRRPFGFHWCLFSGFTLHSSFEVAESSLNASTNFHRNHARPSSARSYISYFRPSDHFGNSNFHHPLNSLSAPHSNNIHHPSWGWTCHFLPYNADRDYIDHSRAHADAVARSPSFLHPLHYTQQPVFRTGESSVANSQSHERSQSLHTSYQEQPSEIATNGFRRFSGVRRLPMIPPPVPSRPRHRGGHTHGFYICETERDESSYVPMIQGSFHHRFSTNRTH